MTKVSWFLKLSAVSALALIVAVASFGTGTSASAFAVTATATAAATTVGANLPVCYATANISKVRVVHASPSSPSVDVYVDKVLSFKALAYGKATDGYVELPAGPHRIKITPAGDAKTVVFDRDLSVDGMNAYTLVAEGTLADKTFGVTSYLDDASDTAGKARIFVIHAVPDAGPVDVVTTKDGKAVVSNLAYGDTAELNLDPATVDLAVTKAGDAKTVYIPLKGVKLAADTIYTVVATGLVGSKTEKPVALKADIYTSTSFAGFPAPVVATPEATAAVATVAVAVMTTAPTSVATAAAATTAAPVATVAATAVVVTVAPTNIPTGKKPSSAGLVPVNAAKIKHLNDGKCPQVRAVTAGGPADVAGIKANDLILGVDGVQVKDAAGVLAAVAKHASGDKVPFTIQHTGSATGTTVIVTLGANPFAS